MLLLNATIIKYNQFIKIIYSIFWFCDTSRSACLIIHDVYSDSQEEHISFRVTWRNINRLVRRTIEKKYVIRRLRGNEFFPAKRLIRLSEKRRRQGMRETCSFIYCMCVCVCESMGEFFYVVRILSIYVYNRSFLVVHFLGKRRLHEAMPYFMKLKLQIFQYLRHFRWT